MAGLILSDSAARFGPGQKFPGGCLDVHDLLLAKAFRVVELSYGTSMARKKREVELV